MGSDDAEPPGAEWQVEISDMRAGTSAAPMGAGGLPCHARSPRERALRIGLTVTALTLAVALLLAGNPDSRTGLRRFVVGLGPPPTATLMAGEGAFNFYPNPPGTEILVDGKVLAVPPPPGSAHPLVLPRG